MADKKTETALIVLIREAQLVASSFSALKPVTLIAKSSLLAKNKQPINTKRRLIKINMIDTLFSIKRVIKGSFRHTQRQRQLRFAE